MNRLDQIIAERMPTVMVPAYEDLSAIKENETRLLMARNGLYIETKTRWGHLVKHLWCSPRQLPYGNVEELDTFKDVLSNATVQSIIKHDVVCSAAKYARSNKEWGGFIALTKNGFQYIPVEFDSTAVKINYRMPVLPEGAVIAVDIHSHGRIAPFFSRTDNEDDKGGVKIAVVLGHYRNENEMDAFDIAVKYCVEGFHFDLDGEHEK